MSAVCSKESNENQQSFEDSASFWSRLLVLYLNPLFKKGANAVGGKKIELVDLGATSKQDRALGLYTKFVVQWEWEKKLAETSRSLWSVLWRTIGYDQLFNSIFLFSGYSACSFGPVLILNALVKDLEGTQKLSRTVVWILVALMFAIPMFGSVLAAQSNIIMAHAGVQIRNALVYAIYRKSLQLSPAARQQSSTGQIINMFSNDTKQLQRYLGFLNQMVLSGPTIAVSLFLIYREMGVATFVGLALIVFVVPMNAIIFGAISAVRRKKVIITDKRVKLMNEILNGIRIIKYYAWEHAFQERVQAVRLEEVKLLQRIAYIVAVAFSIVLMAVPAFLPVLVFYTYVKLGNELDSAKAFTSIALFNLMQFPFLFLPLGEKLFQRKRIALFILQCKVFASRAIISCIL